MTSNALKLTREMKIALTVLVAGGALGGVYLWSASRTPESAPTSATAASAAPSTPTAGTAPATTPTTPAPTGAATPEGSVERPKRAAEPQQIPFLTTTPPAQPKAQAPKPVQTGNLNAALPNPFRPFSVENSGADTAVTPPNIGAIPAPIVPGAGMASAPTVRPGGFQPGSAQPGIGAPIALPSIGVNAAPFPMPTVPGAPRVVPVPRGAPGALAGTPSTSGAGTAPPAAPVPIPAPAPVKPPVPALRAPSVTPALSTPANLASSAVTSSNPAATPPTSGAGAPSAATPGTGAVQPSLAAPALVAELGTTPATPGAPAQAAAPETPTPLAAPDPLSAYIAGRDLSYNAVVLGPVNTGIFQTKSGYVVVSIGQKLPDSNIVVRDITASAVTLALGNSQKTLELDKR